MAYDLSKVVVTSSPHIKADDDTLSLIHICRSAIMSLSDYMYRDLTKGSIAKGLIWFALAGPVGEVGIRIAIPTGWFFTDTILSLIHI